jgi:hypothetical protein
MRLGGFVPWTSASGKGQSKAKLDLANAELAEFARQIKESQERGPVWLKIGGKMRLVLPVFFGQIADNKEQVSGINIFINYIHVHILIFIHINYIFVHAFMRTRVHG